MYCARIDNTNPGKYLSTFHVETSCENREIRADRDVETSIKINRNDVFFFY